MAPESVESDKPKRSTGAMADKTIGGMNGPWALILKLALATYPVLLLALLTWGTWMTVNQLKDQSFREQGYEFIRQDYRNHLASEAMIHAAIDARSDDRDAGLTSKVDSLIGLVSDIRIKAATSAEKLESIDQRTKKLVEQMHELESRP